MRLKVQSHFQFFTLIACLLLSLSACVKNQDPIPLDLEKFTPDGKPRRQPLTGDPVICEGDCPETVAAFSMGYGAVTQNSVKTYQVSQCSATLIANDQILTNKHCLKDVLKAGDELKLDAKPDAVAADIFIEIKFPKTKNFPYEVVKGKKILSTSGDFVGHLAPDWAIVQLEKPLKNRKTAKISKTFKDDALDVVLYPVDYDHKFEPTLGVIRAVNCRQVFNQPSDIFSLDSESPLFRIEKCDRELVPGMSGTGVFAKEDALLMGVTAKTYGLQMAASGTVARCLSEECFYAEDPTAIEIYKLLSHLNLSLKERDLSVQNWDIFKGIQLQDEGSFEKPPELEFQPPWSDFLQYLVDQNQPKLKNKFIKIFTQVIFPRLPKCVERDAQKNSLETPLNLPAIDLEHWDLRDFEWTATSFKIPTAVSRIERAYFKNEIVNNNILLENSTDLPAPLKKAAFKLPFCQ